MIRSLQAGRGLAALAVVGFHFAVQSSTMPAMKGAFLARAFRHGNAGVDFFFVLSGFIIMFAHARDIGRPDRLLRYLRNRFLRLYPIYWLYTAVVLAVAIAGFSTIPIPRSALDWISVIGLVRVTTIAAPLNVAWTLYYEVAFYVIFATLIVNKKIGLVILMVWLALVVVLNRESTRFDTAAPWASRLCLNFFIGMLACWTYTRLNERNAAIALVVGLVLISTALVAADAFLTPSTFGSMIAAGCGLVICGAAALERTRQWNLGILANIGNASYTIYLVHVHVGSFILKKSVQLGLVEFTSPDVIFLLLMVCTVVVSYGLYVFVEKPLLEVCRIAFSKMAGPAQAVGAL